MSCAKAGPHWRRDLPKTTSVAIELLPIDDTTDAAGSPQMRRLDPFPLSEVHLSNGTHVARASATNLRYLRSLATDDLLYAWRSNAWLSQPAGARPLRGWESPGSELRGHILGHWLSASALSWATTGDAALLTDMRAVVATLEACQQSNGWLAAFPESFLDRVEALKPVWAPYYTTHKLLQGLLDQHELAADPRALPIAMRLAAYIRTRVRRLIDTHSLSHHYETLNKEFGGLNEVLWRLSATAADGATQLRSVASLFDRPCLLGPLAAGQDTLSHMHANTQLPVLTGAHARYEVTGDGRFRRLTAFFAELLLRTRTFATGGSSVGEYCELGQAGTPLPCATPLSDACEPRYAMLLDRRSCEQNSPIAVPHPPSSGWHPVLCAWYW